MRGLFGWIFWLIIIIVIIVIMFNIWNDCSRVASGLTKPFYCYILGFR